LPRVEDPPDSLLILFDDLLDGQLFESSSNWLCTRSTELDVGIVVLLDLRLSVGEVGDVSSGLRVGDNDGDSVDSTVFDSGVDGFSSGLKVGLRVGANDGESVGSSVVDFTGLKVGLRVGENDGESVGSSVFDSGVDGFSSGLKVGLRVGANDGESVGSSVVVLEMTTGFLVGERVLYDVNEKVNRSHA
jgi:hypothetical protein